jgi:hypothetical protein
MTEALTSTLPAAPVVVEIMATSPAPSDESEAEIVGEISASDDILKKDTTTTGELRKRAMPFPFLLSCTSTDFLECSSSS